MLNETIVLFLGISISLYCLFAGADFGAGILELFCGKHHREEQKKLITHAIGPVWEANHVWLILALVILMNGYPKAFAMVSTVFHIPLTVMLIGIVLRGCAFTFRHYDAIHDRSQSVYSFIFILGSLITPFMLGVVAGALFLGRIPESPESFADFFIRPWLNGFSFSVGAYTCTLFAFLSAVYLIGETDQPHLQKIFSKRAYFLNIGAIFLGLIVFLCAQLNGLPLAHFFLVKPFSLLCMALATLILIPLWFCLDAPGRQRALIARVCAGAQMVLILLGWFHLQFPVIFTSRLASTVSLYSSEYAPGYSSGYASVLTFYNSAAPDSTLIYLLYALIGGSFLIFPALFLLLKIFKVSSKANT